jgi:hypothetical protein
MSPSLTRNNAGQLRASGELLRGGAAATRKVA